MFVFFIRYLLYLLFIKPHGGISPERTALVDIEAKGKGLLEVMNVFDTSPRNKILFCEIWYDYFKGQKSCGTNTKPCSNPYKDLEVLGQRCVGVMNIHGDRLECLV